MAKHRRAARFLAAAALLACAAPALAAGGYGDSSLASATLGAEPAGRLAIASDGSLVGTAAIGGPSGNGTVFRVDTHGRMKRLHAFDGSDGETILAGLTPGPGGWLYGATAWGAANGLGGVFRLALDGRFEMLHAFDDGADRGASYPFSALTLGPDGNFYGTTVYAAGYPEHNGTVFRMTPDGQLRVIYVFGARARNPYAGVTFGPDGMLYGLTASDGRNDCGQLYALATDGTGFRIVHTFSPFVDGCQPRATMAADTDGTLVGTTQFGGPNGGQGVIFRLDTATQAVTVLHVFHDDDPLGYVAVGGVTRDAAGTFYGTSSFGSTAGHGAVWSMAHDGTLRLLHAFTGGATDGSDATTAPVATPTGIAGATFAGGATDDGTVYRLQVAPAANQAAAP